MEPFMLLPPAMINKMAVHEILECNEQTARFGLQLSASEALELVETRAHSLRSFGRVEFAGGMINKLILRFCDSPFLSCHNYASALNDLIETFYYFKNETLDEISDDELIGLMKVYFDGNCQGSLELLQNRELEALARNIRYGLTDYWNVHPNEDDPDNEEADVW
ncbi:MAG: hypothetical protein FNP40_12730 [Dehalobacter sp. 4CP]|uniref:DUF6323 family protein n=1 Tax=Dehalobacter sp. CP TaxID=2594474 RepID=UPI0013C57E65|nr:hypothetical protein [Dehalobacter sp. 4CP]